MRETEEKPGKEAMRPRSERREGPFPRREHCSTCQDSLACGEAEEGGQGFWDAEELDPDQALGWRTGIARRSLCPREAVMRPLRARQQGRTCGWLRLAGWGEMDLPLLVSEQLHASPAMGPPAPVPPEEGSR